MSKVFKVLPFGSNWCLAFVRDGIAKGLVAVRTTEDEVRSILSTVEMLVDAGAQILVSIPADNQLDAYPGVDFLLGDQYSSWVVMTGPKAFVQQPVAPETAPGILTRDVLSQYFPSSAPYPGSLGEIDTTIEP